MDEASEQQLKDFFEGYDPLGWFEAEARLLAYASDPVRHASKTTREAHSEVRERYRRYASMADDNKQATQSGQLGIAHGADETMAAPRAVDPAVKDAEEKDEALIKLIRDELRSKPEAATLTATHPGKRHRCGTGDDNGR